MPCGQDYACIHELKASYNIPVFSLRTYTNLFDFDLSIYYILKIILIS